MTSCRYRKRHNDVILIRYVRGLTSLLAGVVAFPLPNSPSSPDALKTARALFPIPSRASNMPLIKEGRLTPSGTVSGPAGCISYHGGDALVVIRDNKILVQDALSQFKMVIDLTKRDTEVPERWAGDGFVLRDGCEHELQAVDFVALYNDDGTYRVDSKQALWFHCVISA